MSCLQFSPYGPECRINFGAQRTSTFFVTKNQALREGEKCVANGQLSSVQWQIMSRQIIRGAMLSGPDAEFEEYVEELTLRISDEQEIWRLIAEYSNDRRKSPTSQPTPTI